MPFTKGSSGNPAGRPPKNRALTAILEQAGSKTVQHNGKPLARKRLMAEALWSAIATGKIALGDEDSQTTFSLDIAEWLSLVQFIYKHIDGPPPSDYNLSGEIATVGMTLDEWKRQRDASRQQAEATMDLFADELDTQD